MHIVYLFTKFVRNLATSLSTARVSFSQKIHLKILYVRIFKQPQSLPLVKLGRKTYKGTCVDNDASEKVDYRSAVGCTVTAAEPYECDHCG